MFVHKILGCLCDIELKWNMTKQSEMSFNHELGILANRDVNI